MSRTIFFDTDRNVLGVLVSSDKITEDRVRIKYIPFVTNGLRATVPKTEQIEADIINTHSHSSHSNINLPGHFESIFLKNENNENGLFSSLQKNLERNLKIALRTIEDLKMELAEQISNSSTISKDFKKYSKNENTRAIPILNHNNRNNSDEDLSGFN